MDNVQNYDKYKCVCYMYSFPHIYRRDYYGHLLLANNQVRELH
jgi:hypothetical protein